MFPAGKCDGSFSSGSGWSATGGVVACCATAAGYFKGSRDSTKQVVREDGSKDRSNGGGKKVNSLIRGCKVERNIQNKENN